MCVKIFTERRTGHPLHAIALAHEGERLPGPAPLDDSQRLLETVDTDSGRVVSQTYRLVLLPDPSGPDPELEPPLAERVDAAAVTGHHDRMAVVVCDHHRGDPHRRHLRRQHEQGHHRQTGADVIGGAGHLEPGVLGLPHRLDQLATRGNAAEGDTEPERMPFHVRAAPRGGHTVGVATHRV